MGKIACPLPDTNYLFATKILAVDQVYLCRQTGQPEIFFFRSLFRNSRMQFGTGQDVRYTSSKWLWIGAMAFHYCFLVVIIRHLRFFTQSNPWFVTLTENIDGFFEMFVPAVYQSGLLLGAALTFLLLRRLLSPQLRYISLPADYFPLFLILTIAGTGILMRYGLKTDIVGVKELTMGHS